MGRGWRVKGQKSKKSILHDSVKISAKCSKTLTRFLVWGFWTFESLQQPRCGDPNTTTTMVFVHQHPPQIHRKSNAENGCFLALWAVFWPCGQIFWRRKWCTNDRSGPSSAVCDVCIGAQCSLYWARASAWGQFRHMSHNSNNSHNSHNFQA